MKTQMKQIPRESRGGESAQTKEGKSKEKKEDIFLTVRESQYFWGVKSWT